MNWNLPVRPGITLIELMAVIVILAIASGSVLLVLRKPLQVANIESSVTRVGQVDGRVRRACELLSRRGRIEVDIDRQKLIGTYPTQNGEHTFAAYMSGTARIETVFIGSQKFVRGSMSIDIEPDGSSGCYGIKVGKPGAFRFLVFVGGTGQLWRTENEAEVASFFREITQIGVNTD